MPQRFSLPAGGGGPQNVPFLASMLHPCGCGPQFSAFTWGIVLINLRMSVNGKRLAEELKISKEHDLKFTLICTSVELNTECYSYKMHSFYSVFPLVFLSLHDPLKSGPVEIITILQTRKEVWRG